MIRYVSIVVALATGRLTAHKGDNSKEGEGLTGDLTGVSIRAPIGITIERSFNTHSGTNRQDLKANSSNARWMQDPSLLPKYKYNGQLDKTHRDARSASHPWFFALILALGGLYLL